MTRIVAAHQIRYRAPQYLVEHVGDPLDTEDLEELNYWVWTVLTDGVLGWGEYTHIIHSEWDGGTDFLARLE